MIKRHILFLALLSGLLVAGCARKPSPVYAIDLHKQELTKPLLKDTRTYGIAFNPGRTQKGLPLLPDSFILYTKGLDHSGWINNRPDQRPVYHNKSMTWSADSLFMDRSFFLGPKDEQMIIICTKVNDTTGRYKPGYHTGAVIRQYFPNDSVLRTELTLEQADSVLLSWHLTVH